MNRHGVFIVLSEVEQSDILSEIVGELNKLSLLAGIIVLQPNIPLFLQNLDIPQDGIFLTLHKGKLGEMVFGLSLLFNLIIKRPKTVYASGRKAAAIAMPTAMLACIPRRIYTRHHGSIHHDNSLVKSIIFDRLTSIFSTKVIAVSHCVSRTLLQKDRINVQKHRLILNGIRIPSEFENLKEISPKKLLQMKYPRILVISRTEDWKSVASVVEMFKRLVERHSNAHLSIVGVSGNQEYLVQSKLNSIPQTSFTRIQFSSDIYSLLADCDVFVHVPQGECLEAFGLVYLEALYLGKKCVFTKSGVLIDDFDLDGSYFMSKSSSPDDIYDAVTLSLRESNPVSKFKVRATISNKYSLQAMSRDYLEELIKYS